MDSKTSTYIGYFAGIGALIMGWLLPIRFPDIPIASQWCLLGIGVVFIIGSFICMVKPGWFEKKRKLLPIWEAIHHIAHKISESPTTTYYQNARSIIRQKAQEGKITIWGKKQIDDRIEWIKERKFSEVLTEIPKEYWSTSKILPCSATDNKYVNNPYTAPEAIGAWKSEKNSYADLRIDLEEVKAQKYV